MISDAQGVPLLVVTTPANVRDERPFLAMLDALPTIRMPSGRKRRKPGAAVGDRGYGFPWIIKQVVRRRIQSLLDPRGSPHGSGLGKVRWMIERTMAWMTGFRRIVQCYERLPEHWQAFNDLACCMICANRLAAIQQRKAAA